jgi:hypothetical protein
MRVWNRLKSAFEGPAEVQLPPKLDPSSQDALSRSIRILPLGHRGWITMQEARFIQTLGGVSASAERSLAKSWARRVAERRPLSACENRSSTPSSKAATTAWCT